MSKSNAIEIEKEVGDQVRLYVYKVPKKNHDTMLQICSQFIDMFSKHGCHARSFQLDSTETSEGFTSMTNAVSAAQDDEVWLDMEYYRDREHMNDVVSKIESDESALSLMKQYLDLLTPGSSPIREEFSRLKMNK
jgi:uncharacterized protein YbaA (DUF1428 family)